MKGNATKAMERFERESGGYGAEIRPTAPALTMARHLASRLDALAPGLKPRLAPGAGGGVQFEYHSDGEPRRELEIEALPDGRVAYLVAYGAVSHVGAIASGELAEVLPTLVDWVEGERCPGEVR